MALGLAVGFAVLAASSARSGAWLLVAPLLPAMTAAFGIVALGVWDDLWDVSTWVRLSGQVGVALGVVLAGGGLDPSAVPGIGAWAPGAQHALASSLSVLWIVGLTNAMNLLDGLDGLAAGTAVVAFGALAAAFAPVADEVLVAVCLLGAAAACGFLVFNRPPASVFMGDGGSTLLGMLLALAGLHGIRLDGTGSLVLVPVVALGLPLLDTGTTIVRRLRARQPLVQPDADHLHHRAVQRTGSARRSVRWLLALAAAFGGLAVALRLVGASATGRGAVLLLASGLALGVLWGLGYVGTPREPVRATLAAPDRHG